MNAVVRVDGARMPSEPFSPPMPRPRGFTVQWRNPGHWDVWQYEGRQFHIRGEPGAVLVADERREGPPFPREWLPFRSVTTALAWCAEELMREREAGA